LSEVEDTSILKTGRFPRYRRSLPLGITLRTSLLPPLSQSDLVRWHITTFTAAHRYLEFASAFGELRKSDAPLAAPQLGLKRGVSYPAFFRTQDRRWRAPGEVVVDAGSAERRFIPVAAFRQRRSLARSLGARPQLATMATTNKTLAHGNKTLARLGV
jgi:hypothetical protein